MISIEKLKKWYPRLWTLEMMKNGKRLQRALEENIAKYERAFGPIRLQEDGVDTPPILDIKGEA